MKKKKMINNKFILLAGVFCMIALQCVANRPDTANPYFEINRVMGTLTNANHISFNTAYYYEESSVSGIKRDTLSGIYKINGQKYYAKVDSTEMIQNDFYNVAVNKKDSTMIIARTKTVFPVIMSNDVLDPVLQSSYLSKIVLSDSATTRKLSFVFNDISPYASYELVYDTVSYNMNSVKYSLKHYGAEAGISSYYTQIRIVFTNYQTNVFTDTVFDTSTYFTRVNGVFVAASPYSTYDIFNQVMNQ